MNMNGSARWIGSMITIIVLAFSIAGVIYAGALKRIETNEVDVRRIDKSQGIILYQLEDINKKLDRLLGE